MEVVAQTALFLIIEDVHTSHSCTMGVGPALSAESKAGIIAMLTAAVKDSEEHVRSAACGALGTVGVDPVARRPKLCWMPIASPMSASVRCGP